MNVDASPNYHQLSTFIIKVSISHFGVLVIIQLGNNTMRIVMMSNQQNNHKANQGNPNKGTSGTNPDNAKVHGNRGKQLNPNQK